MKTRLSIAVTSRSKEISSQELRKVLKAINIQLRDHFAPYWNIMGSVKYVSPREVLDGNGEDALIWIDDKPEKDEGYLGFHDRLEGSSLPYGVVYLSVAKELKEHYSTTLSHEVLELLANRHCNAYCLGPSPTNRRKIVAHWMEMCDAVQQSYKIDGVAVSDFVTPLFFTPENEEKGVNNFLKSKNLLSFCTLPNGYLGYYDFSSGTDKTFFGSNKARARHRIKGKIGKARRYNRVRKLLERS